MTAGMSCSTSRMVRPRSRRRRDHRHRLHRLVVVHAGERLVEQQDRRVGGQPDGDAQGAQMAMRQRAGDLVPQAATGRGSSRISSAERAECALRRALRPLVPRKKPSRLAFERRWCAMMTLSRTLMFLKIVVSWKVRTTPLRAAMCGARSGNALAPETHLARCRLEERRDQLEQCRLAGAVGTDHRQDFPLAHREGNVVDGDKPAEAFGQA